MDMFDDARPREIGNSNLRVCTQWLQIIIAVITPPAIREARRYVVLLHEANQVLLAGPHEVRFLTLEVGHVR